MPYALIVGGIVSEVFTPPAGVPIADCFHPGLTWADCTAMPSVEPGWTYSGGTFAAPPPPPAPSIAAQAAAMLATGCEITSAGTPALNGTYAVDQLSQMHIVAIETGINAGKGLPGGGAAVPYPDVTGATHAFSAAEFTNFAAAVRDFVFTLGAVVASNSGTLPAQPTTIA